MSTARARPVSEGPSPRVMPSAVSAAPKIAASLAITLVLLVTRSPLERWMGLHMLVQIPVLLALGVVVAPRETAVTRAVQRWNRYGAAGLLLAFALVSVWMVPRMLDAAADSMPIDVIKALSLVCAGVIARVSWRNAPTSVRVFAVGNGAWMTATVGMLLLDAPGRLCVSYGIRDQLFTGYGLLAVSLLGGAALSIDLLRGNLTAEAAR